MPLPSDLLCARIAVQRGLVSDEKVRDCLELQAKNRKVGYDEPLPAVLLKRGYIGDDDAKALERDLVLGQFIRAERAFAKICVDESLLSTEQATQLLEQQRAEGFRTRIGDRLIERRILDPATRERVAAESLRRLDAEDDAARREELGTSGADHPAAGAPPPPPPPPPPPAFAVDATPPPGAFGSAEVALAQFQEDKRRLSSSSVDIKAALSRSSDGIEIEGMQLVDRLGQGTIGVTWKARPASGGPPVALKVLSPSLTKSPELMARFQRAFERAQGLAHPALVRLGPLQRSGELAYYTMELVDGESLAVRVERSGPLPSARVRDVAREVARALAHVHGQRLLHGAIRPSNVLLGRDGSVKVSDLMLTRVVPRLAGPGTENDPSRLYASPEELTGAAAPDPRDDVYSYGLVLAFALTGRPPFPDAQPSLRLVGPVDPRQDNPAADPQLSGIVARATAPARQDRFRDGGELIATVDPGRLSDRLALTPADGSPLAPPPPAGPAASGSSRLGTRKFTGERPVAQLPPGAGAPPPPPPPPPPGGARRTTANFRAPEIPGEAPPPPPVPTGPAPALRRGFETETNDASFQSVPTERTPRRRSSVGGLRGPAGADLTGQVVNGRYKILDKLGEGGMGVVYRAEHTRMAKTIAFKVLHPSLAKSEESVARFQREVLAMAQFTHRNVVRIYDAGKTEDGRLYMAMELVEGQDLANVLADEPRIAPARAVSLLRQVLRAVGEGHGKGIVHRDLKPENILLAKGPAGEDVVKVMDFGIAKILEADNPAVMNQSGPNFRTIERVVLGTPEYMSPEQASGSPVDSRSDLYSLGVIAYEVLLGRLPFDADSPVGFIGKHIVDPPLTFDEARPGHGLSGALEAFVMKALEKDPQERFQTAEEMLRALEEAAPAETQLAAQASVAARAFEPTPMPGDAMRAPSDSSKKGVLKPAPGDSGRRPGPADSRRPADSRKPADSRRPADSRKPADSRRPAPGPAAPEESTPGRSPFDATPSPDASPPPARVSPAPEGASSAKKAPDRSPITAKQKRPPLPEPKKGPPVALLVGGALAALAVVVAVAVGLVFFRRPALKTLMEKAAAESTAAESRADWEGAKKPWEKLAAEVTPEEQETVKAELAKVAGREKAALDRAARQKAFESAVAQCKLLLAADEVEDAKLDAAVKAALESASDKAQQDQAAELEQRAKVKVAWQRGVRLAREATTLDAALESLTTARRATTDPSEQSKLDDLIATVKGDIYFREAQREFLAHQYEAAQRDVLKAMNYRDTPERQELFDKIKRELEQINSKGRAARVEQTAEEGDRLEEQGRLEDARDRLRDAIAECERPPALDALLAKLKPRLAAVQEKLAAIQAYEKLGALPPAGSPEPAVKDAIARREKYLESWPAGPRSDKVREEVGKLREAAQTSAEGQAKARQTEAVAKVRAALDAGKDDEAKAALDELRKLAADAPGALDADVKAFDEEIAGRAKLVTALRRDFVLVPAGKRPAGWEGAPLGSFYLGRAEVTNAEYWTFCLKEVHAAVLALLDAQKNKDAAAEERAQQRLDVARARWPEGWEVDPDPDPPEDKPHVRKLPPGKGSFPVTGISFEDAQAYCAWRTANAPKGQKVRFRLPHEVEWERAARGDDGRLYPWGNDFVEGAANWKADALAPGDEKVWARGMSPYRAIHMAGNVAEYCDDEFQDASGARAAGSCVVKGGSFRSFDPELLSTTGPKSRVKGERTERKPDWGFRVLAELGK